MEIALGQQYNVREKSTSLLYSYINRHAGHQKDSKNKTKQCSTSSNMVVIIYYYVDCKYKATTWYLKRNHNETRPSEHPLVRRKNVLGGIKGCKYETYKYETSSWHLNGFPDDGNSIGSTV